MSRSAAEDPNSDPDVSRSAAEDPSSDPDVSRSAAAGPEGLLPRRLSAATAAAILIGSTIGSGIFRVPSVAAEQGSTLTAVGFLWVGGALLTFCGALTVAELAALFPRAGGIYVYLLEGFGPLTAFLFGWTRLLVIEPALLGGIALVFAEYTSAFLPLGTSGVRGVAILALLLVGWVNARSVAWGAAVQNVSTVAKVAALAGLALTLFLLGDPGSGSFAASPAAGPAPPTGTAALGAALLGGAPGDAAGGSGPFHGAWASLGVGLIAVLWAYDGWADATYMAGEVTDPGRSLPRALAGGFAVVAGVYLLLNAAYLYVLPLDVMAASERVAADAASAVLGRPGASVAAGLVLLSTFGALNGTMMSGPRVFFALGRDGLFFRSIGRVHPRTQTPHLAVLLATALGIAFVSARTFEQLAEAFILGLWPFYMLAVLAVFRLRRRRPGLVRPYRTPGYPYVPALFLLVSVLMLLNALLTRPLPTLFSLAVIASGAPVYRRWVRARR